MSQTELQLCFINWTGSKFVLLKCLKEYFRFFFWDARKKKIRKIVIWRKADTPKHQTNKKYWVFETGGKGGGGFFNTIHHTCKDGMRNTTKTFALIKYETGNKKQFNGTGKLNTFRSIVMRNWIKIRYKYISVIT